MVRNIIKKNIIKNLLLSASFLVCVSGVCGMEAAAAPKQVIMGRKGHTKEAFAPGNLQAIEDFRIFYRRHGKGEMADRVLAEHHESLNPFANYLLEKMQEGKQSKQIQKLTNEVERNLNENAVSPVWLIDAHFRYLTLLGDMSAEEKEVFFHVPHNKYLKALLEKNLKGEPCVLDLYQWGLSLGREREYFYKPGTKASFTLSKNAEKKIEEEIVKHLPSPVFYPLLGEALLPMELIINCWIDGMYLIGMPVKNIKAVHGEEASALGFAFHDLFHFKLDERWAALGGYISSLVARYVQEGGFALDVIPHLVPLAVQKYQLIMEALRNAHDHVKGNKQALVGEFIILHEAPSFSETLFTLSNPVEILQTIIGGSLSHYEGPNAWENPSDELDTSPLTGESRKSDTEIKEIALLKALEDQILNVPYDIYNKTNENGEVMGYVSDIAERKELKKEWFLKNTRFTVTRLRQFIDATFELPSGEEKTYSFPTLVRKWKNIEASAGLLGVVGIAIQKPNLTQKSDEENRAAVIAALEDGHSKIVETINVFATQAKASFGEGPGSYAEDYAARFRAIQQQLEALIKQPKQASEEREEKDPESKSDA
jgi:hypothetical protein